MYYVALAIVLTAILIPIWIVDYPGMVDYPNHLARCYILAHYHDNPFWQQLYYLDYTPLPNLAMDAIVAPLAKLLPILLCGKLFLSLSAVLFVVGCSAVGRVVTGRPNWLALVAAFTFYNSELFWGFLNCVFGMGVFLCVFAYWMRVRNAMTPLRFCICGLLSIVAFLAHLSSVSFLYAACFTVALLEFIRDRKFSRLLVKLAWLIFPVLLMAAFMKGSGHIGHASFEFGIMKLVNLLAPVNSYSIAVDAAVIAVLLICLLVILKRCRIHSVAAAGLVLLALSLVCPPEVLTASGVDARFVVPGYLLLVLSIEPFWDRWRKAAIATAIGAMMLHTASIAAHWRAIDHASKQVLAMGEVMPAKASVYVLQLTSHKWTKSNKVLIHDVQLWAVTHEADVSILWALHGQQPLVFRTLPCAGPDWARCFSTYDYVFTYEPTEPMLKILHGMAAPASSWDKATLWRMSSPAGSGSASP